MEEAGELPLTVQAKLLRALQEKEIRRLGGRESMPIDVRIIAATKRDLEGAMVRAEFREDLYYRLNVIHLHLPPLRARQEDIPLLAQHFLTGYSRELEGPVGGFSPEALDALSAHTWPGNVRELENTMKQALMTCRGYLITAEDLRLGERPITRVQQTPPRTPPVSGWE